MKLERWVKAKEMYVEGVKGKDGVTFPTFEEIAEKVKFKPQTLRVRAGKEKWLEQRKLYVSRVENSRQEKKSEVLASESAAFALEVLKAARQGLAQVNKQFEMRTQGGGRVPVTILDTLGSALNKYQKSGQLALGETTDEKTTVVNNQITVASPRAKKLTEDILSGKGTE